MTDRSFSFVRIHTRIDLRSHTAASYPCISNIASCMPSPVRCTLILQKKSRTFSRPAYSSVNSSNFSSSTTAWALPFTPSFNITLDIWFLTVLQKKSRTFSRPAYSSVNSSNFSSSTTAWALPFTPSFNITLDIWFLTVLSDMFISFAISLVL